uniref:Uncharacterized protein n=1 Tax=Kalanchoe fedtschenkoi TaxID=63787 RepID=A0A7N0RJD7_KALFE
MLGTHSSRASTDGPALQSSIHLTSAVVRFQQMYNVGQLLKSKQEYFKVGTGPALQTKQATSSRT